MQSADEKVSKQQHITSSTACSFQPCCPTKIYILIKEIQTINIQYNIILTMNIFRGTGDMSHAVGIILLLKMAKRGNASGMVCMRTGVSLRFISISSLAPHFFFFRYLTQGTRVVPYCLFGQVLGFVHKILFVLQFLEEVFLYRFYSCNCSYLTMLGSSSIDLQPNA
jgi:hypothetical protein